MTNKISEAIKAYSCLFFSVQGVAEDWNGSSINYDTYVMIDPNHNTWDWRCLESKIASAVLQSEQTYRSVMVREYKTIDPTDWLDDWQIVI